MTWSEDRFNRSPNRFSFFAFLGASISLAFCFWKGIYALAAPVLGIAVIDINPHLQAVLMWMFAAGAVAMLAVDRRRHGDSRPLALGGIALFIVIGTLYGWYHDAILAAGYVLRLVATFLNQTCMLSALNRHVGEQAEQLSNMNEELERRVADQVTEIERLARLRRFLSADVAEMITSSGQEALLESHRRYIACVFCDIRRFTSMNETMEPEDVMDVLRGFHEEVGRLTVRYSGTIGYRAGDGVMVFFNDPVPCDNPDLRAVQLSLEFREIFASLCEKWLRLGADVGLGIGIASGYATMGVIGVEGRFDYTPIGNAVNLSARLSDQAQDDEILIGYRSRMAVEGQVEATSLGTIVLKGIAQPVEVYRVDGLAPEPIAGKPQETS